MAFFSPYAPPTLPTASFASAFSNPFAAANPFAVGNPFAASLYPRHFGHPFFTPYAPQSPFGGNPFVNPAISPFVNPAAAATFPFTPALFGAAAATAYRSPFASALFADLVGSPLAARPFSLGLPYGGNAAFGATYAPPASPFLLAGPSATARPAALSHVPAYPQNSYSHYQPQVPSAPVAQPYPSAYNPYQSGAETAASYKQDDYSGYYDPSSYGNLYASAFEGQPKADAPQRTIRPAAQTNTRRTSNINLQQQQHQIAEEQYQLWWEQEQQRIAADEAEETPQPEPEVEAEPDFIEEPKEEIRPQPQPQPRRRPASPHEFGHYVGKGADQPYGPPQAALRRSAQAGRGRGTTRNAPPPRQQYTTDIADIDTV